MSATRPAKRREDPCWTAFRKAREQPPGRSRLFLRAWLLARGLGYRSRNQPELIATGIEDVYPAALGNRLPDDGWQVVEPRSCSARFTPRR